jgi:PhnB protein
VNGSVKALSPLLNVRCGTDAIAFYKKAFGVEERFVVESEDGHVVATLGVGAVEFWIADESPEHGNPAPVTINGASARMILISDDPDALFAQALQAGARVVWPVDDQHGWRVGRLVDPFGHHWEISRPPQS